VLFITTVINKEQWYKKAHTTVSSVQSTTEESDTKNNKIQNFLESP